MGTKLTPQSAQKSKKTRVFRLLAIGEQILCSHFVHMLVASRYKNLFLLCEKEGFSAFHSSDGQQGDYQGPTPSEMRSGQLG
jgi:hypothetical protein